ncbi:MAG: Hint domain-containing protein [Pseudomonadota bacterium]
MPVTTIYALDRDLITISGGESLSNPNQGSGVQLQGLTITLNSNAWSPIDVNDSDNFFNDSDNSQTLVNPTTLGGVSFTAGRRVEAEYTLSVEDPDGNSYTLYGFNINEPGVTSYTTVEGLAFLGPVGGFPPIGVPLTVTGTSEGPGGSSNPYTGLATPPCFTPGTLIETPNGPCLIEDLKAGDLVETLDRGPQPLTWVGQVHLSAEALRARPALRPIKIERNALGPRCPSQTMIVSPQHRILVSGWRASYFFGETEVLVAAKDLCNGRSVNRITPTEGVCYMHLLFDGHELIRANNLASESLFPGPQAIQGLGDQAREELLSLFPELKREWSGRRSIRASIKSSDAAVLAMA